MFTPVPPQPFHILGYRPHIFVIFLVRISIVESEVTTVTVAHRLATVRRADLVIYLKDGHSIAQGTFAQVREVAPDFDRQAVLLGL